jgi:subtilisin family serine protease
MRATLGLIFAAVIASLALPSIEAQAQSSEIRAYRAKPAGKQNYVAPKQSAGTPGRGAGNSGNRPPRGGSHGGGHGGVPGWVGPSIGVIGGIIATMPPADAAPPGRFIDDPNFVDDDDLPPRSARRPPPRQQQSARRARSGVPPAGETRMVPDEVVIELPNTVPAQQVEALQRRYRLERLESRAMTLAGTTYYRWRIPDRRSVAAVVRALEANTAVASAQPNYLFTLQQSAPEKPEPTAVKADPNAAVTPPGAAGAKAGNMNAGDPAQYALAKLRLGEAHALADGDNVLVAVIDSGVDLDHPELKGAVAGTFDTLTSPPKPHPHGTAIAALIAGQGRLKGAAPAARILAIRAFDPDGGGAAATTFNILKGIDWAVENHARIVNMSFAGPADPAIQRALEAANKKGVVSIAAAGNAGPKSPPLYPAAYPGVIAVAATDADDRIFKGSNRGRHIAVAAPGVDIFVAVPDGGYQMSSGTSYSAAEVSGIVALMLQRRPDLTPAAARAMLMATAKDLGPKGRDNDFGAGLADAYRALTEEPSRISNAH